MASPDANKNPLKSFRLLYVSSLGADRKWVGSVYARFLGGVVLGSFLVLLPLLYSDIDSLFQLTALQVGLSLFVILACGTLTAKLGEPFLDAVMKGFGNSGF